MVDKKEVAEAFLSSFKANRQLTYELLATLSDEELNKDWPRPGYNTFGKQMLEMAHVLEAFSSSIAAVEMDMSDVPEPDSLPDRLSNEDVRQALEASDKRFEYAIRQGSLPEELDFFGERIGIELFLANVVAHEIFHHGQMAIVMYLFKIPLPSSWIESWAMPQVPGKGASQ